MTSSTAVLTAEAQHLLARYAWSLDAGADEAPGLASVFTEDVEADYEGFTCRGVDALAERLRRLHAGLRSTQHLVGSVLAVPRGEDRGVARSHVRAGLVAPGGRRLEVSAVYVDDLVRTQDGWRIRRRKVKGVWMDGDRTILPWMRGQGMTADGAREVRTIDADQGGR